MHKQGVARWCTGCTAYKRVHQLYPAEFPSVPVYIQRVHYIPGDVDWKDIRQLISYDESVKTWSQDRLIKIFYYAATHETQLEWGNSENFGEVLDHVISQGISLNDAFHKPSTNDVFAECIYEYAAGTITQKIINNDIAPILLLHSAVSERNCGVIELFLKRGADPNLQDADGYNALDYTICSRYSIDPDGSKDKKKIIALLLKHGAILPTPKKKFSRILGLGEVTAGCRQKYPFPELL